MIHLFNRAKLLATWDLECLSQVREALMDAEIDCIYRTRTLKNPAFFSETRRMRTDSSGENGKKQIEYVLYVCREDLERAKTLL